jgi:hypothetical protein
MSILGRFVPASLGVVFVSAVAVAQSREIVHADGSFYSSFGVVATMVGDVDGDGRVDLLVGAPDDGGLGSATIRSGRDGSELRRHDGEQTRSMVDMAVARLDDVNGDGVADYVFSAPYYFDAIQQKTSGKLYVHSGSDGALIWSLVGIGDNRQWGTQLAPVGDVDGDGATDFVVNKIKGGAVHGGRLELLSGANGASIWVYDSPDATALLGTRLARVRDVDGDGIDEIAATSPDPTFPPDHNRITLFSGANAAELWHVVGSNLASFLGDVADGGDVDGDGLADVAAGAPSSGSLLQGSIHFLSGADGHALGEIDGESDHERVGETFSDGFDADGDGDPDIAVIRFTGSGEVTIDLYDARSQSKLAEVRKFAQDGGVMAAAAGDVDGDGFGDLLLGNPTQRQVGVVLIYAMRSPPTVASVTPPRGDHHADTPVTLAGSGFLLANSLQVSFGTTAATNVAVVDDATITCTAPAGAAGLDDVVVTDDAGSATLPGGFAATPALRIDGDPVVGGTLTLRFLCNPGDDLFVIAGLPPAVTIPTPPYEGALCILPFLPLVYLPAFASDEFDLVGSIPNDPALSGQHFLVQALVGAPLGGPGKNGSWTNCGDVAIQ